MTNSTDGLGTQLRRLLELLDGELESIYREDGYGYRPRFTPVMKALATEKSLTIKEIAARSSISHSAASQTITHMVKAGLVHQEIGDDARERLIGLTSKGHALLPLLRRRWAATKAAADTLDAELEMPLSSLLASAIDALEEQSFRTRIEAAAQTMEEQT